MLVPPESEVTYESGYLIEAPLTKCPLQTKPHARTYRDGLTVQRATERYLCVLPQLPVTGTQQS